MKKLELLKQLKDIYSAPLNQVVFMTIPALNYLMIDGQGDPNTSTEYKEALQTLYSVAYTLKFQIKKSQMAIDYPVMPLEGLWWVDDMKLFTVENKKAWKWTMMILQPELVNEELVKNAIQQVIDKKGIQSADKVRLETLFENKVVQLFHKGPYSAEADNIQKIHQTIEEKGFIRSGKHHEIYLNSPLKTAPENLKTILRQPYSTSN
jgi:hypothetical protein